MKVNANLATVLGTAHEEKWVALTGDRKKLVDSDKSLLTLRSRLGDKKAEYVYMKVLRSDMEYSF